MNANGRLCRRFKNGNRHLARICGGSYAGGRRIYKSTAHLSVGQLIEKARRMAAQEAKRKRKG